MVKDISGTQDGQSYKKIQSELQKDDGRPWLSMSAILFLEMILDKTTTVLEAGAGRSTIWIARRAKEILSYESSALWHRAVTERLKEVSLNNAIVKFDPNFIRDSFHKIEGEFDVVFLDGSDSPGDRVCGMRSGYKYVKPGGYLIVDDTDQPDYAEGVQVCRNIGWPRIDFWGYGIYVREVPKLCSVWRRPNV